MTISLRLLARSRRLRAMAVLAWLMLVVNSLAAAPMGMTGVPHSHAMQTTMTAVSEHRHHRAAAMGATSCCDDHAGCCDGMAGQACHCAAMCSTTLLPGPAVVVASTEAASVYAVPLPLRAPSLDTAPPLRPPAV